MFLVKRLCAATAALLFAATVGVGGTLLVHHAAGLPTVAAEAPPTKAALASPPALRLTVHATENKIRGLTLRESDDEFDMKTAAALARYLKRAQLDRSASSELVIVAPPEMKYADMVDVLDACQKAGFGRVTVERQRAPADALVADHAEIVKRIDALIARSNMEQTREKYLELKNNPEPKQLLEEAKRFYEQALDQAKIADAAGKWEAAQDKLLAAKRFYERAMEQVKKADLESYYGALVREKTGEAQKPSPQVERDTQQLQGRWRATLIHDDGHTVRDEAALQKFEWLIAGEYLVSTTDGTPRLGSIQFSDNNGLRFSYNTEAKSPSFAARYRLDGDTLTVVVPGKDSKPETVIAFRRVKSPPDPASRPR